MTTKLKWIIASLVSAFLLVCALLWAFETLAPPKVPLLSNSDLEKRAIEALRCQIAAYETFSPQDDEFATIKVSERDIREVSARELVTISAKRYFGRSDLLDSKLVNTTEWLGKAPVRLFRLRMFAKHNGQPWAMTILGGESIVGSERRLTFLATFPPRVNEKPYSLATRSIAVGADSPCAK